MPRFDLNGDPLPDDGPRPAAPAIGAPPGGMGAPPAAQQYDLMGNPIGSPPQQATYAPSPPAYAPPPPAYAPPAYAPPPHPYAPGGGYGAPPPGAAAGYSSTSAAIASASAQDTAKNRMFVWIGSGVLIILLAFWIVWSLFPPSVPAPSGYTTYVSFYKTFSVDQPNGWTSSTADSLPSSNDADGGPTPDPTAHGGVLFKDGTAKIDITQGSITDVRAAALLGSQGISTDTLTANPLDKLFQMNHDRAKAGLANYEPGAQYSFQTQDFGEGESESFTASGPSFGIGGPVHGYYVAMCGSDKTVAVVCECREKDWQTLKPVFQHVVNSLVELGRPPTN